MYIWVGVLVYFSCKEGEFDRFFDRLDRPVEKSRPDRCRSTRPVSISDTYKKHLTFYGTHYLRGRFGISPPGQIFVLCWGNDYLYWDRHVPPSPPLFRSLDIGLKHSKEVISPAFLRVSLKKKLMRAGPLDGPRYFVPPCPPLTSSGGMLRMHPPTSHFQQCFE